jgi:hypothetical protein
MNANTVIHESHESTSMRAPAALGWIGADSYAFGDDFLSPTHRCFTPLDVALRRLTCVYLAHCSASWRSLAHRCAQELNLPKQTQSRANSANWAM